MRWLNNFNKNGKHNLDTKFNNKSHLNIKNRLWEGFKLKIDIEFC